MIDLKLGLPLTGREQMAAVGLFIYLLVFFICMFLRAMNPVFYTVVVGCSIGQLIVILPCIMALVYPMGNSRPGWADLTFYGGMHVLLLAPQSFCFPAHADFVPGFAVLTSIGSALCLGSFYFVNILELPADQTAWEAGEYSAGEKKIPIAPFKFQRMPPHVRHGEWLRGLVFLGIFVGILGSSLFAFVSLTGGGLMIIFSAIFVYLGIYAARTNWFAPQPENPAIAYGTTDYGSMA